MPGFLRPDAVPSAQDSTKFLINVMSEKLVPSLSATHEYTAEERKLLEFSRPLPYRSLKVLDARKFEQACYEEALESTKVRLKSRYPAQADAIDACATLLELQAFSRPHSAQLGELIHGRFVQIEELRADFFEARLYWGDDAFGDGHVTLSFNKEDGKVHADTEGMGRELLRSFLLRLADEIVIDG
jgi:hypothetical protein